MLKSSDAQGLAEKFGLPGPAELTGPVERGELGQVWRLDAGAGRYAVKETFTALDDPQIARVVDLQRLASTAGVHTPRQLVTVDGDLAVSDFGPPVRVYAWVDLQAADRGLDPVAVGEMLAALHTAAPRTREPVDPFFWAPIGAAGWQGLITDATSARAPFAADLRRCAEELITSESIMVEPTGELIITHRDLWADNVRTDADRRLTVIDWDNCGAASAAQELAMVVVEFGTDAPRAKAVYDAYRAAGGPASVADVADFTMPLAIFGHLCELDVRRWIAADTDEMRQRAVRRLAECTEDLISLATVRGLLAALA